MTTIDSLYHRFLQCNGASTDTRAIAAGSMFFALKGPHFNANTFVAEALSKGASAVVVDEASALREGCILVPNVLAAMQELATHHRRQHDIPFIGITGSNGKTTTKELIHAVLSASRPTLATQGNLNNHIGVPLTLLKLAAEHQIAIIEMGANKPGDIAELCAIAEPTHGLITNIGKAHLEGFGGYDGVLRTKTELYASVKTREGLLFVNADDDILMEQSGGIRRMSYGTSPKADAHGKSLSDDQLFLRFAFSGVDGKMHEVRTRLVGEYNLPNAMAAVAVGQHFGVPDQLIAESLAAYTPSNNRSQLLDNGRNLIVLDAYNANPSSMSAALRNLAAMESGRERIAILGDMLELGKDASLEHARIVELAAQLRMPCLFAGPLFSSCAPPDRSYANTEQLRRHLESQPVTGKLILVKGSRGIGLERIIDAL